VDIEDDPEQSSPVRSRRNPIGFIIDLFRPKRSSIKAPEEGDGAIESSHYSDKADSIIMCHSPVKRQKESEVLESLEKIQISREDNPVLAKLIRENSPDVQQQNHHHLAGAEDEVTALVNHHQQQ